MQRGSVGGGGRLSLGPFDVRPSVRRRVRPYTATDQYNQKPHNESLESGGGGGDGGTVGK